jgi:hypothetical protein
MPHSYNFAIGAGTLKAAEQTWDFIDGLSFEVRTTVPLVDIVAGNFDLVTMSTIDVLWPSGPGHFSVGGRVYTYTSISDDTFVGCNGAYGDQAAVAIVVNEYGYQAVSANFYNSVLFALHSMACFQSAANEASLLVDIHEGIVLDGTTEYTYAGAANFALTDDTENYVYAYITGGVVTIAKSVVSWAAAKVDAGVDIIPLAHFTTAGGIVTNMRDVRQPFAHVIESAGVGAHDILSTSHSDTTPASLVAGDILYASMAAPPKLTRRAQGAPGTVLTAGVGGPDWVAPAAVVVPTWMLGDGSQGAFSKSDGSTTTLTTDVYYSSVTLTNASHIITAGFMIFCTGTVDIDATSSIKCNGGDGGNGLSANGTLAGAPGAAGASSNAAARFHAGAVGVIGVVGGNANANGNTGTTGTASATSIYSAMTTLAGGAGGNGGAASGPPTGGPGGVAGTLTPLAALASSLQRDCLQMITGCFLSRAAFTHGYWTGWSSGGAGGSGAGGKVATTSAAGGGSGGSGGNGGCVCIAAMSIVNAGTISANGGKGGNGGNGGNGLTNGNGGGGAGGGAGGCGGEIILVYHTLTNTGTISVAAGAGGTKGTKGLKAGTGYDGVDGNDGTTGLAGTIFYWVV